MKWTFILEKILVKQWLGLRFRDDKYMKEHEEGRMILIKQIKSVKLEDDNTLTIVTDEGVTIRQVKLTCINLPMTLPVFPDGTFNMSLWANCKYPPEE